MASPGGWSDVPWRAAASCGTAYDDVAVCFSESLSQCYVGRGVRRCSSVWQCAQCKAAISSGRQADVKQLATAAVEAGYSLYMLTLTVRHDRASDAVQLVAGLSEAWRRVKRRASWRAITASTVGHVRALEVTQGDNGIHPHLHVLFVVRDVELFRLSVEELRGQWADTVVSECGEASRPSAGRGWHLQSIDASAATYIAKLSAEVTRADLKSSARSPFAWVPEMADSPVAVARWAEYCKATKGRHSVRWSTGLREFAGLSKVAPTDEELALADIEDGRVVASTSATHWNVLLRKGRALPWVEDLERRCRAVMVLANSPPGYSRRTTVSRDWVTSAPAKLHR